MPENCDFGKLSTYKKEYRTKIKPQSNDSSCNIHVNEQNHTLDLVEPAEVSDLVCAPDSNLLKNFLRIRAYLSMVVFCTPQHVLRKQNQPMGT